MAYDLEEQEQLDTLKAWWKQYGNLITWLLIIVLSVYAAWTGWKNYQNAQSSQASQLYDELQKSIVAKDNVKVQRAANDLIEKFTRTSYAPMAALSAAKSAFDSNDLKLAKSQLQWVVDHSNVVEYKALAQLRLAGIALDEKAYDAGLTLLSGEFPAELAGNVLDRKGDLYLAQNKVHEARVAYQASLEKIKDKNPGRKLIQIKLDAIGGAVENNVATNAVGK
ncbi:MAG: tetratricopeptide repeat protein [Undibacterium sp.]|nr:tetratricopeptide repeat protein [Undibacterium sp.]MDO8701550.1 tetratricopeptide repeat protein [Undibacterium sp.]